MAPLQLLLLLSLAPIAFPLFSSTEAQGLNVDFYKKSCPKALYIVRKEVARVMSVAPSLAGPLLRIHFHDCFVNGCEGSVLLNSTSSAQAEKDAIPNLSLRGYGVIDGVKALLEKACPQIVSCADILALVARDVVTLTNGPTWNVPLGRRDGRSSVAAAALAGLPQPFANATTILNTFFIPNNLNLKDLVVLSGSHTLGTSHCQSFSPRLYNFTGKGDTDPTLDSEYVAKLKSKCPPTATTTLVEMDPGSFRTFDLGYYKQVAKRRSLFTSDESLLQNGFAKAYIARQAVATDPSEFFADFGTSMIKMGNIGVLTGSQGEIRKKCALIN